MKKTQLDGDILENLMAMLQVDSPEEIPKELLDRCERVEVLIRRVKLAGALRSTQILAMVVESWLANNPLYSPS